MTAQTVETSRPAAVVDYFLGWVTPRRGYRLALFLRFRAGDGTYEELGLASERARAQHVKCAADWLAALSLHELGQLVTDPLTLKPKKVMTYHGTPVLVWPNKLAQANMRDPRGRGPNGGHTA
jgi:hypothetical protein